MESNLDTKTNGVHGIVIITIKRGMEMMEEPRCRSGAEKEGGGEAESRRSRPPVKRRWSGG